MDNTFLQATISFYYQRGLAPSTQKLYHVGQQRYIHFCSQHYLTALPSTEFTLLSFAAYLAKHNIMYSTIKVYISAIRNLHVMSGQHHHFANQLTPRLEQVLRGIKRDQSSRLPARVRLPITIQIMQQIKENLLKRPHDYNNILMWAICCTAFFGFLRCSEFTVPKETDYDPNVHLSYADVAVDCKSNPRMIQIQIKQSKTDPFRKGVKLSLGRTDCVVCPVSAILAYLAVRGAQPGPLFLTDHNKAVTRPYFSSVLTAILTDIGLPVHSFNTHSFRIGAATSAKQADISDSNIKTLGRWRSDTYQSYIRMAPSELAKFSSTLASQLKT